MAAGAGSSSGDYDLGRDYTVISVSINPDETPASYLYDIHLRGPATAMLSQLAESTPDLLA